MMYFVSFIDANNSEQGCSDSRWDVTLYGAALCLTCTCHEELLGYILIQYNCTILDMAYRPSTRKSFSVNRRCGLM